jgi:hypothetical protein
MVRRTIRAGDPARAAMADSTRSMGQPGGGVIQSSSMTFRGVTRIRPASGWSNGSATSSGSRISGPDDDARAGPWPPRRPTGYGIWNSLLARHPSNMVAPFSMLVPVVGVLASWLAFDEIPDALELLAGALVVSGVLVAARTRQPRVIGLTMSAMNSSADKARNSPATT